jgi:phosphotransferase system  glucose/maltose/N-acetylglucosamine-specific IIC component
MKRKLLNMETEKTLLSVFVAVESAHAFSAFCPSIFTIQELANQTDEGKRAIRLGYIPAIIFSVILSVVVAKIVKSWLPVVLALFTDLFMVISYESALAMKPKVES